MEDKIEALAEIRARVSLRTQDHPESDHLYILDGFMPVHVEPARYVQWYRHERYMDRYVKESTVGSLRVETYFEGIDHFSGLGSLLLFVTRIQTEDGEVDRFWRTATWEIALACHDHAVSIARELLN